MFGVETNWLLILAYGLCLLSIGLTARAFFRSRAQLRFSLRSLLIVTTLVAFVLGLAVWAGR